MFKLNKLVEFYEAIFSQQEFQIIRGDDVDKARHRLIKHDKFPKRIMK